MENGVLLSADRTFGLGKITYLAFNPFELPLAKWNGRKQALTKTLHLVDNFRGAAILQQFAGGNNDSYGSSSLTQYITTTTTTTVKNGKTSTVTSTSTSYGSPGRGSTSYSTTSSSKGVKTMISTTMVPAGYGAPVAYAGGPPLGTAPAGGYDTSDPFSTTLPPTSKVFTLLGAYFVVVVPLNFLILRKFKRGELAWFTAPIISLGFAGALFASAGDLYSAKMSSAAQGLLVGQEGIADGMFIGKSQLFVPRAGSYDLKMKGVDSLGILSASRDFYGGRGQEEDTSDLNPQDTGEITIPEMHANNLAFREIAYRQRVPVSDWFSIEFRKDGKNKGVATVRNTGPYVLDHASVVTGGAEVPLTAPLQPGESKIVTVIPQPDTGANSGESDLKVLLNRNRGAALTGSIVGLQPGPQLGKPVQGRTAIQMILFAKEALGPKGGN